MNVQSILITKRIKHSNSKYWWKRVSIRFNSKKSIRFTHTSICFKFKKSRKWNKSNRSNIKWRKMIRHLYHCGKYLPTKTYTKMWDISYLALKKILALVEVQVKWANLIPCLNLQIDFCLTLVIFLGLRQLRIWITNTLNKIAEK